MGGWVEIRGQGDPVLLLRPAAEPRHALEDEREMLSKLEAGGKLSTGGPPGTLFEHIEENISKLLDFDKTSINLKGKSVDNLGIIGNNEASAAFVSISLNHA